MDPNQPTDHYLSLILTFPNLELYTLLSVFFLTLARIIPIMVLAPFLGGKNAPAPIRMMFATALVLLFLPANLALIQKQIPYDLFWIALMLKELVIGLVLGFLSTVPFYLVQMSGTLIDHSRGSSALQVSDPTTQSQTSPIGILLNYTLIATFFLVGGPILFFEALGQSYALLPVDQFVNQAVFDGSGAYWKQVASLLSWIFSLSVRIAAPALIGILLTDLFLGIANRLAPQVQIVFLGISLKSWVGIALLTAAWGLIIKVIGKESVLWIKTISQLIQQIGLTKPV